MYSKNKNKDFNLILDTSNIINKKLKIKLLENYMKMKKYYYH